MKQTLKILLDIRNKTNINCNRKNNKNITEIEQYKIQPHLNKQL